MHLCSHSLPCLCYHVINCVMESYVPSLGPALTRMHSDACVHALNLQYIIIYSWNTGRIRNHVVGGCWDGLALGRERQANLLPSQAHMTGDLLSRSACGRRSYSGICLSAQYRGWEQSLAISGLPENNAQQLSLGSWPCLCGLGLRGQKALINSELMFFTGTLG